MSKIEAIKYHTRLPTLCVFRCNDQPLFAAREIAEHLGYVQLGSLRKQTFTAWELSFHDGRDYFLYTTAMALHPYKWLYDRIRKETLKPVKPERGRLFFTVAGLLKVFDRTTKNHKDLLEALKGEGVITTRDLTIHTGSKVPKPSPVMPEPVRKRAAPIKGVVEVVKEAAKALTGVKIPMEAKTVTKSLDERRFEYEALCKLLRQLERLDDPALRNLAVMAAETALGKKLPNIWTPLPTATPTYQPTRGGTAAPEAVSPPGTAAPGTGPAPVTVTPVAPPQGPYFIESDYYSLSRIGEKAGGYASVTAGKAADIIGARIGYSRDDLRTKELPINEIKMRPDSHSGTARRMVRFNLKFSNAVVLELRKNAQFEPAKVKIPEGVVGLVSSRS